MPRTEKANITKKANIAPEAYSYEWTDAEQSSLKRTDAEGNVAFVPAAEGNRDYAEFLSSGAVATAYVEPPAPKPPTPAEKLEASGLTVDELKSLLGL